MTLAGIFLCCPIPLLTLGRVPASLWVGFEGDERTSPEHPKHVQWETDLGTWQANLTHGHFVVGEMSCSRDRCAVWHCRVEKWHLVHGVVKTRDNNRSQNFITITGTIQISIYHYHPGAVTTTNTVN